MKTDIVWASLIEACYQECPDLSVEAVFQTGLSERRFYESLGRNLDERVSSASILSVYSLEEL